MDKKGGISKKQLAKVIRQKIKPECFLSNNRSRIINTVSATAFELNENKLWGNGHNRVVLGPKGSGKTFFFKELCSTVNQLLPNVVVLYFDVSASRIVNRNPLHLIIETVNAEHETQILLPDDTDAFHDSLKNANIRVLLVLDEYHTIYSRPEEIGGQWRESVFEIGNKLGKIQCSCILSGNAPYMRALCFGKYPLDTQKFPSYTGIARNLNTQRFKVIPHENLRDKTELTEFLAHIAKKMVGKELELLNDLKEALFLWTGGNMRSIFEFLRQNDQVDDFFYCYSKSYQNYTVLFKSIARALDKRFEERGDGKHVKHCPWKVIEFVSIDELFDENGERQEFPISFLYEAADNYAILFHQSQTDNEISFATPLHGIYTFAQLEGNYDWLTPNLRLCLRYPFSKHAIVAEEAFRRSICEKTSRKFTDSALTITHTGEKKNQIVVSHDCSNFKNSLQMLESTVCKESPDLYGADCIYFERNEGKGTLTRIHLKLGSSPLGPADVESICSKLVNDKTELLHNTLREKIQARAPNIKLTIKVILATTRPLSDKAIEIANKHNVEIWNRTYLFENIWSSCIKEWATAESVYLYLPEQSDDISVDDEVSE